MITGAPPSLAELGDLSPGLRRVFDRYGGSGMLSASSQELQRLRRHLLEYCRVDPSDMALFDHFPPDDRRAIVRELHAIVHARMQERQAEHARRLAAQRPVEELRRALLSEATRERLIELGIWAHMLLCQPEVVEALVDTFFDLTTAERVRAFAAHQEQVIAAFREAVLRRAAEQQKYRQRSAPPPTAASAPLASAYACLGLPREASRDVVAQTYRTLAKQHHPDCGGDETRMKEINQAYATIASVWRR